MTCPGCMIAYDPDHWDACPHCGWAHELSGEPELSGVMRTSTILIAAGNRDLEAYGSVDEVPEPLRRLLVTSTNGLNSGTIYIADQSGRERITRALRDLPTAVPAPALARFSAAAETPVDIRSKWVAPLSVIWFLLVIAAFCGAIIWLAGSRPW